MIGPVEFIPIAEEFKQIQALFESVLRQACAAVAVWESPVRLAVNVSAGQFTDDMALVKSLSRILEETGFPPNRLEVEITEAVFISKTETARKTIERLHEHGITIALDDFGQGYSSLAYLSQFDIDRVKIDRSFLSDRSIKPKNEKIVSSVIDLSCSLGMQTTAEGVETQEDALWLRRQGCRLAQGYLFSKPLPMSSAHDYFKRHSASIAESVDQPAPD